MSKKVKKFLVIALVIRLILVFIGGFHPDLRNHIDWGKRLWQYGFKQFYEQNVWSFSWPNQPVGTIYLFGLIYKLQEFIFKILFFFNTQIRAFPSFIIPFLERKLPVIAVKFPFILADIGLGYLIYVILRRITKSNKKALTGLNLFLFNPALIYNSAVWGQTDSLINLLALLGLWLFWRKKYFWGFLAFIGSLYFKLSLIIWLPVLSLLLLKYREDWLKMLKGLVPALFFFVLSVIPFVNHRNLFSWIWYLYFNRVLGRRGDMLSGNAFNFWTLIYGVNLGLKENTSLLGTTAKRIGNLLTILIGLGLGLVGWLRIKAKSSFKTYLYLAILLAYAVFLFMTNMHERYLYPIFAPLAVLTAIGRLKPIYFYLLSGIHLINLYNLWYYPKINFLKSLLLWQNDLIPRLLSLALIILFVNFLISFYNENSAKKT